jgi:transcription-repair coupling factor (superfamily II helicase)
MMLDEQHKHEGGTGAPFAHEVLTGVPDGLVPLLLGNLVQQAGSGTAPPLLVHIARDDRRLEAIAEGLAFFAPKVRVIQFPAWDTVP